MTGKIMLMRLSWLICAVLIGAFTLPASRGADAHAIVHALASRYQHTKTLKAVFYERYREGKSAGRAESGTVYFSKPGRMRWEYESPEPKLFLVDGTNAWFYVPADKTASRAKMKDSSDWRTPIALLAGKADLGKLCRDVQLVDAAHAADADEKAQTAGDSVLRCVPREDAGESGLRDVLLETDADAHLVRVVIRQAGEIETEFRFGNWEENLPVTEDKFHFQPPPGVAIVDEGALSDEVH
jgi:outer membrane lipoprotein carrier protein